MYVLCTCVYEYFNIIVNAIILSIDLECMCYAHVCISTLIYS